MFYKKKEGNFTVLDKLYCDIVITSCRHITHTGQNNMPSTKNYCYHETTKKDKEKSTDALDAFIVKSGVLNKTVKSYIDRKE